MPRQTMLETLAGRINAIRVDHTVRVAIDGPTAAGKTILADQLVGPLRQLGRSVIRASIDGFHNPSQVRYRNGRCPKAYYRDSFNYQAVRKEVLDPLGPAGTGRYTPAVFDFRTEMAIQQQPLQADAQAILLFDGVMLARQELADCWDFHIFVDVDPETSARRSAMRDADRQGSASTARDKCLSRYLPGQQHYARLHRAIGRADAVVVNDDPDRPILRLGPAGAATSTRRKA
ncbi:MAG: uridine kinase [Planctomycetota bacterium]